MTKINEFKMIITHGGQRQVVETGSGEIIAVDDSDNGTRGTRWFSMGTGEPIDAAKVLDLVTPRPKTLVLAVDITGLGQAAADALVAALFAQTEGTDEYPDVAATEWILDGDQNHVWSALSVGLGL